LQSQLEKNRVSNAWKCFIQVWTHHWYQSKSSISSAFIQDSMDT